MNDADKLVDSLFDPKLNRPESKYGSTRSTLFGKFYERIISKWLEEERGYSLERWQGKATRKPRIYWNEVSTDKFDFYKCEEFKGQFGNSLKNLGGASHCTPDGVLKANGRFIIWEAKNWPLWREEGDPKAQIMRCLINRPWVLATHFDFGGDAHEISRFLFSWWDLKPLEKKQIEDKINNVIGQDKFEIILTRAIMKDCIANQYGWYEEIIRQEQLNVMRFFDQCLGKSGPQGLA